MEVTMPSTANRLVARYGARAVTTDCLPYTLGRARSDYLLNGPIEKYLADKRFAANADVKQAATFWLQKNYTDLF